MLLSSTLLHCHETAYLAAIVLMKEFLASNHPLTCLWPPIISLYNTSFSQKIRSCTIFYRGNGQFSRLKNFLPKNPFRINLFQDFCFNSTLIFLYAHILKCYRMLCKKKMGRQSQKIWSKGKTLCLCQKRRIHSVQKMTW